LGSLSFYYSVWRFSIAAFKSQARNRLQMIKRRAVFVVAKPFISSFALEPHMARLAFLIRNTQIHFD